MSSISNSELSVLAQDIKRWGKELGFQQIGISDIDMQRHKQPLMTWLEKQYHGDMSFMERHAHLRLHPEQLHEGTARIISARMDYLPPNASFAKTLSNKQKAYVSRYAVGRDYHKVLRSRLKKLGDKIAERVPDVNFRPFVDSAPVLEHAAAEKAGIGWTGKHSLTLHPQAGSWFFLGELFINLPLPIDIPIEEQCGSCTACITVCPTNAIVAPYVVDGRRCISYLTIESDQAIPVEFRKAMGNRIYGCDDCQLICPWNRFAQLTSETDFNGRQQMLNAELVELFCWSESQFLENTQGSAIRRIGYEKWQRNIAVALGNADYSKLIIDTLTNALASASELVAEHIEWALQEQHNKATIDSEDNRKQERLIRSISKGLPRDA